MSSQQALKGAGVGGEVNRINNTIFSIDTTQPIIKYKYLSLNLKSFCANFGLSFLSEIFVFSKMTIIKKESDIWSNSLVISTQGGNRTRTSLRDTGF